MFQMCFQKDVQLNGWRAYRDVLEPKPYFKGFSIWFIGSNDSTHAYQIHSKETEQLLTGGTENNFYKIGKF